MIPPEVVYLIANPFLGLLLIRDKLVSSCFIEFLLTTEDSSVGDSERSNWSNSYNSEGLLSGESTKERSVNEKIDFIFAIPLTSFLRNNMESNQNKFLWAITGYQQLLTSSHPPSSCCPSMLSTWTDVGSDDMTMGML